MNNQTEEKGIVWIPDAALHACFVRALSPKYDHPKETL